VIKSEGISRMIKARRKAFNTEFTEGTENNSFKIAELADFA